MSDDRPVSLAAVIGVLSAANEEGEVSDNALAYVDGLLTALPTVAPIGQDVAPVARRAYVLGYQGGHEDTVESRFTFEPGERWDEDEQLRADVGVVPVPPTPTAREWSGPDAVQACFEPVYIATPGETDALDGFVAIGPWEPGPVWVYPDWQTPQGQTIPMPVRDWRRPLRRVSP